MFQRCYSLALPARPVAMNVITRFISKSNGSRRCLSRELEKSDEKISSKPDVLSESAITENENYALERYNSKPNSINTATFAHESCLDDHEVTLPHPLDTCTEDLSDVGPYLTPTFTFAKYANKSRTIQELVKLGVALYKFESKEGMVQYILNLDFERDVKPYIRFLHDCGVPADYLGHFITKNPNIFKEDLDDLHTRIRYLRAHSFDVSMIKTILCKNPNWLLYSTKDIDGRLGYFQTNFKLNGSEVRLLTVKGPKVVTYKMVHLLENTFSIKEEMEFDQMQIKKLLLKLPKIWVKNRDRLLSTFEYAHNEMQLQRDFIVQMPNILLCRKTRLQQRHLFLMELKKAQYDPSKPMYVSPKALIGGTDADFCRDVAMTSIEIYNAFLKTF
ncbi:transcription termination factor 3, mitochondrial [Pogonomyrmex barbatus]|uniref:Transcription termination factor 3, mitochondrial n=1 Tax=Pogonomyrmex barbatus TaxID=144034 RepID=A0A6I9VR18_9HYME|nr:transcription termination factor 3, mitochondrial [Pogonomyrmex barbatus]